MSRRTVAPVLLLVAAALSIAAVFVVHEIESAGGPLSQPSAVPPYFSPNGDGIQDVVEISFTTKRAERVTLDILDDDGNRVARLLDDELVDGEHTVDWDGEEARDGRYRAVITRAGDERTYEPVDPIVLDTKAPRGVLDRERVVDGRITGIALLEPGSTLRYVDGDGDEIGTTRVFAPPNPGAESATPGRAVPRGLEVRLWHARFEFDEVVTGMQLVVEDLAGNRTLLATPDITYRYVS